MKKYVGIALIIGILLCVMQAHATVFATAVLSRGSNTVYLLSDMPDASLIARKQRDVLLAKAREAKISIIADDCNDLQAAISALPDGRFKEKLVAMQAQVINGAKFVNSLLPSLVTLGREQGPDIKNMDYESTLLRDDIPVEVMQALFAKCYEKLFGPKNYLLLED